jgi:hypothetical protein
MPDGSSSDAPVTSPGPSPRTYEASPARSLARGWGAGLSLTAVAEVRPLVVCRDTATTDTRKQRLVTRPGGYEHLFDQYEELGVDGIGVLPRLDAPKEKPHEPVPVDEIKRTIDTVSKELSLAA